MARSNGKPDPDAPETGLDIEHELPPAEDGGEAAPVSAAEPVLSPEEQQRLKAERNLLYDRLARLQAEFDNYRKRHAREQAEFREYAVADAARSLLPIVDSLERALASGSAGADLHAGVELILRQFHDALAKLGVQTITAAGHPFDPKLHEAIEMVDTTEAPDHQVIAELQRGYKIKERLLRPAMVRVARNPKK